MALEGFHATLYVKILGRILATAEQCLNQRSDPRIHEHAR
jgi:hypothetical protein